MFLTASVTLLLISSSLINKYSSCDVITFCYPFDTESVKIIPVGVTFHKGHEQNYNQARFIHKSSVSFSNRVLYGPLACTLIPSLSVHCFPKEVHVESLRCVSTGLCVQGMVDKADMAFALWFPVFHLLSNVE